MRLAGVLLGIALMISSSVQAAIAVGVAAFSDEFSGEAWSGVVFLILVLVGASFGYGVPIAGASSYALAAIAGFIGASTTDYGNLYVWGGIALLVSAVTFVPSSQTDAGAAPPLRRQCRYTFVRSGENPMLAMTGVLASTAMLVLIVPAVLTTPTLTGWVTGTERRRTTTRPTPPGEIGFGSALNHTGSPASKIACGGLSQ